MKKIIVLSFLMGLIILTGCYYDKEDKLYPNNADDCNAVLTYNNGIKTLVNASCAISGCHIAGGISPDLSNYTSLKANITKVTKRAIIDKNMPAPSGMSACNITKLDNWIKAGMKEQ
jgi:beta-mannanase